MTAAFGDRRVVGSFGAGAYGPTIFLMLTSLDSVVWLRDLFLSMVGSDAPRDLLGDPGVDVRDIERLELHRASADPEKHLIKQKHARSFVWSGDDDAWRRSAALLEPFIEGRTGHQYLTSEAVDDALVEISYGEPDVMPWGRG